MSKRKGQLPLLNVGFDTEDKDGVPTIYALTSRQGDKHYTAGPVAQGEVLRTLAELGEHHRVAVWTLNIAYDLVNFLGDTLPGVVKLHMARKRIVGADLKGHQNVSFYAIERFLPKLSAASLGKAIGLPKLELPFDDPRRCVRDAQIAEGTGDRIVRELERIGIPLRFSPVSGALTMLETDLGGKLPKAREWVREAGKAGLYGGRTESIYVGELRSKPGARLHYFDFNQQYGKAMLEPLPDYTVVEVTKEPTEELYLAEVEVEVEATRGVGPLPYHHADAGLIFPTGRFRGVWTNEDLSLPGVKVLRYYRTFNFPNSGIYLGQVMKAMMPKANDHVIAKALKKNLYTGLSGKWSQTNGWTFFTHWTKAKPEDYWNGVNLGDYILASRDGDYPRWSNFVWSAFIQSKARRWLWELFELVWIEGGEVLYTDTDSVLCSLKGPIQAKRILHAMSGRLKHRSLRWTRVFGPKAYVFEDHEGIVHLSAKGVPGKLHENIMRGEEEFEGDTPDPFYALLRAGAITSDAGLKNRWSSKKFRLAKSFRNRVPIRGDYNRTRPLRLADGKVVS